MYLYKINVMRSADIGTPATAVICGDRLWRISFLIPLDLMNGLKDLLKCEC